MKNKSLSIVLVLVILFVFFDFAVIVKASEISGLTISSSPVVTGNIFYDDDVIELPVKIVNTSGTQQELNLSYQIVSDNGDITDISNKKITIKKSATFSDTISINEYKFGTFFLRVNAENSSGEFVQKDISYSRVIKSDLTSNADYDATDEIAFATHFGQYGGNLLEPNSLLLDNVGVSWIRDEYSWGKVELQEGVYTFPEYLDAYIDRARESGRKVLLILNYGNPLYDNGGAPFTQVARKAFANYAKAVAEHLKGKVDAYEIWNEWDGAFGWGTAQKNELVSTSKESGALYAELLKEVYPVLKEVDENITVVAGAASTIRNEWFEGIFQNDGLKYCDVFSYHVYTYPWAADWGHSIGTIDGHVNSTQNLMKKYGDKKPVWITECGWSAASKYANGTTDIDQRNNIVRAYISSMINDEVDKVFIYDFEKDGYNNEANREAEFGIVNNKNNPDLPYGASPAYAALGFINNIFRGTDFVKEYNPNKHCTVSMFQNTEENKEVVAMWSYTAEFGFDISGKTEQMQCYDIYGNEIEPEVISQAPIYLVGECGQFDVCDFDFYGKPSKVSTKFGGLSVAENSRYETYENAKYPAASKEKPVIYDIDNIYLYGLSRNAEIKIEYMDGETGVFWIEYKDYSGKILQSNRITLGNTGEWKTVTLNLSNGYFYDKFNGGDFTVKTDSQVLLKSATFFDENIEVSDRASYSFGKDAIYSNLLCWASPNISLFNKNAEYKGRNGWKGAQYIICDIDDGIVYGGSNYIKVLVDYFDEGTGSIKLQYAKSADDRFHSTTSVTLKDTGEWKTATFTIWNAMCENNTNLGDFRIDAGNVCIGRVTVKTLGADTHKVQASYNSKTHMVDIYGETDILPTENNRVGIEILGVDKGEADLDDFNYQRPNMMFDYLAQVQIDKNGQFRTSFQQELSDGTHLVRVKFPDESNPKNYYINLFNQNDLSEVVFKDIDEKQITTLEGLNYIQAEVKVTGFDEYSDMCVVLAVYDSKGKLVNVDIANPVEIEDGKRIFNPEIYIIDAALTADSKAKLFSFNGLNTLKPIIAAEEY